MKKDYRKQSGFTVLELLMALGIFGLLIVGAASILTVSLQSNAVVWDQLSLQNEGRKVMQQVVDDVRRAEVSSIGSYPIARATGTEFSFYANIDNDGAREQVRFFLEEGALKKGIINPSGSPLHYATSTEQVTTLAVGVQNNAELPLFLYFDENYTGTEDPLEDPIDITDIRVVQVNMSLEPEDPDARGQFSVQSTVSIRNLKSN